MTRFTFTIHRNTRPAMVNDSEAQADADYDCALAHLEDPGKLDLPAGEGADRFVGGKQCFSTAMAEECGGVCSR